MLTFEFLNNQFLIFIFFIILINLLILLFKNEIGSFLKIIDYPNDKRKIHKKATPLIGGICILISVLPTFYFSYHLNLFDLKQTIIIYMLILIFFITGLVDDYKPLKPKLRTLIILSSLFFILLFEDTFVINKLIFLTTERKIELGFFSVIFTIFCIFSLYNAINFADGVNGSVISITIFWFSVLFLKNPNVLYLTLVIVMIFLFYFNINGKIFLGNSGSSIISILVSLALIYEYNLNNEIFADEIIFLLFFPGLDMIRVTVERMIKRKKIYFPDNSHFHHYLYHSKIKNIWLIIFILTMLPYILLFVSNNITLTFVISTSVYLLMLIILKNKSHAIK